jgi:hypothetical protein
LAVASFRSSLELAEHLSHSDKLLVEDLPGYIEQAKDIWIADRVENVETILAGGDEIAAAEDGELLGQRALLRVQPFAKIAYSQFTIPQLIHYPYSQRVCESFKKLGFEGAQIGHDYI